MDHLLDRLTDCVVCFKHCFLCTFVYFNFLTFFGKLSYKLLNLSFVSYS